MRRYPQVGFSAARRSASRRSSADVDGRPGGRCGWVQCRAMRRRCQRNSVSGVTSHPARLGRGSAAAIAASKVRSVSVSSGRSTWRRNTASWWRNTIISRFFERPDRTVSRASDARNRYKIRYTTNQHRPASRQVNDHGRVSGTHTPSPTPDPRRRTSSAHRTRKPRPPHDQTARTSAAAPSPWPPCAAPRCAGPAQRTNQRTSNRETTGPPHRTTVVCV